MSKIDLVPITGAQQLSAINDNFRKVEEALNDKVLYRDNPSGEPNQVKSDVDMNGKRIYNLPQPQSPSEPVRYQDLGDVTGLTEEARGYAESAQASAIVATDGAVTAAGSVSLAAASAATAVQAVLDAEDQAQAAAASAVESAGFATDAANSAAQAADKVSKTSDTGAALLPEGTDAQRPTISTGYAFIRGNSQTPASYFMEYWNRGASAWHAFASRPWVTAITDPLGVRITTLEAVPKPVAPGSTPQFVPRAWVRFSGTTILASGNISSVAKSSTGVFVANLITPVVDVNCASVCTASAGQSARMSIAAEMSSVTQCRMAFHVVGTGDVDPSVASLIIVR